MISIRNLFILAVAVLVAVVGVGVLFNAEATKTNVIARQGQLFLPGVANKIDEINTVKIAGVDEALTVQKVDKLTWQIVEKSNFPASLEKIQQVIWGLVELKIVEPKTRDPSKFKELNVDGFENIASAALRLSLLDAKDNLMANFYIGNKDGQLFVRNVDSQESWLVTGDLPVSVYFKDWVQQPLLDMGYSNIKKIVLNDMVISKDTKTDSSYVLEGIAAGMKLESPYALNALCYTLSDLRYEDILPTDHSSAWQETLRLSVETFDDQSFAVTFGKIADKIYAKTADQPWLFQIADDTYEMLAKEKAEYLVAEPVAS